MNINNTYKKIITEGVLVLHALMEILMQEHGTVFVINLLDMTCFKYQNKILVYVWQSVFFIQPIQVTLNGLWTPPAQPWNPQTNLLDQVTCPCVTILNECVCVLFSADWLVGLWKEQVLPARRARDRRVGMTSSGRWFSIPKSSLPLLCRDASLLHFIILCYLASWFVSWTLELP